MIIIGKKMPDAQCRENYERMKTLFNTVVADHSRFGVVYACGVDAGMSGFVFRKVTYTYASYAVGFDSAANEIVILPIDIELEHHAEPVYLKNSDIQGAKMSFISKEITIKDKRLPKKYIQLNVQEYINEDPDNCVLLHKQDEEAKSFLAFFKNQYKK